jgi:ParB family chromosome partitioning protein
MTAQPRRGLGRGLGSLIPTGPRAESATTDEQSTGSSGAVPTTGEAADRVDEAAPAPELVGGSYFTELPPASITPNPMQPRQVFDEDAMAELVTSIGEVGLLQPIVVRPLGEERYELVMGERRWRAAQQAGLERIPAIVRQTGDDDMLRDALLEDFGCTHDELAGRIGRSRPQISNTLRLLKLSPAVQRRVAAGVLSAGHARSLLAVEEPEAQDRLAGRVVSEGISVRGLEEIVAVGDHGSAPARPRRARPKAPGLTEIADRLSDRLDTRVKVDLGKTKGKITVEFASLADLRRIVDVMDPRNRDDRPI